MVKLHTRQCVRTLETVNYATWLNSAILNNNSPSLWSTRRMYALTLFLLLHVHIDVLLEHVARSPWHTDYKRGRGLGDQQIAWLLRGPSPKPAFGRLGILLLYFVR